ncbi:hypothetical protein [Pseudoxanthomonas indica]|uniref:Uncharacterized protein n=1 Tax=Pseudoxanthomonas indica TaxID=428993 RepID=A0A1T5KS98_9GAMM|nr:hypothetical protein [Pseudoxanthomonas indica]GGD50916.1 hypothetical protein GCM10007235_23820 [Pseudoxanthomonas indica]SKC66138.1 hypothetical protein SAMN06296058_1928 [Pseudoxanthomonas indica]
MWDIFKAELGRFRIWAFAYAVVQIVVLGFLTRVVDLAQQPLTVYQVFGGVFALTGLLLGAYQMGGYRRGNVWLNLLHRPLPHARLALALIAAAAVVLAIAVLLPLLVIASWQDSMTARVVDGRHWVLCGSAWLIAVCAYLAGAYAMLASRRYGFAGLALLLILPFGHATGLGAVVIQLLLLALLLAMVLVAFKPDLSAAPTGLSATLLTAAPLQFAMWFALVMVGFGVEFVWIAQGSHPNNRAVPLAGGEKEAENAEGKDLIVMGLQGSRDPQAALWREQAQISEVFGAAPVLRDMPTRNELTNLAPMEFDDNERRLRWVFSHDRMRFVGYSLVDQRAVGELGEEGNAAFADPVMPGPAETLVSRRSVYQYDGEQRVIIPRLQVPANEQITDVELAGDSVALLSNRALYFYDAREFADSDGLLTPRQRVALPGRTGDLQRIDMIELLDGHLVSFLFTRASYNAEGALPLQSVIHVSDDGDSQVVGQRQLKLDYSAAWRFQNWYPAPAIYETQRALLNLFAGYRPDADKQRPPIPTSIAVLALGLMLTSFGLAIWHTRRTDLSPPARWAWIAACGLLSLPALVSLWLIHPRREDWQPTTQTAALATA